MPAIQTSAGTTRSFLFYIGSLFVHATLIQQVPIGFFVEFITDICNNFHALHVRVVDMASLSQELIDDASLKTTSPRPIVVTERVAAASRGFLLHP